MGSNARALGLIAQLAACAAETDAAMQRHITPYTARRQELLTQLGEALSGFEVGDTIYSPDDRQTLRITGFTAMLAGGSYYWVARGISSTGPLTANGIFPNRWQLAQPPRDALLAKVP